MRLVVLPGVLRPPSDAELLISVMREHGFARGSSVLDVFTGSGVMAAAAAREGARTVTAIDISRRAALNARINSALNRAGVRVLRGDLFAPVAGERFDLVVANPPYIPSESDALPEAGAARAWDAGTDGRAVLDPFCEQVVAHLRPGGRVLLVHSTLPGEEATLARLAAGGLEASVLARQHGPLGPIVASRAALLERRGILAPGQREEEVLVIEGVRPPASDRGAR